MLTVCSLKKKEKKRNAVCVCCTLLYMCDLRRSQIIFFINFFFALTVAVLCFFFSLSLYTFVPFHCIFFGNTWRITHQKKIANIVRSRLYNFWCWKNIFGIFIKRNSGFLYFAVDLCNNNHKIVCHVQVYLKKSVLHLIIKFSRANVFQDSVCEQDEEWHKCTHK